MGLDDRDYMRERGRGQHGTRWNDRKARVEQDGAWFSEKNRGFDYQKGRAAPPRYRANWMSFVTAGLSILLVALPMYGAAKRSGYMPDFAPAKPFPESGSVTVSPLLEHRRIRSRMKITTAEANALVQLYEPETNRHLLSIYVAANDSIEVPVPSGTFRVRLIEGQTWHGPKLYFGSNTSYETVAELMSFTAARVNGVDLHRTPNGNLPTRMMITNPEPI